MKIGVYEMSYSVTLNDKEIDALKWCYKEAKIRRTIIMEQYGNDPFWSELNDCYDVIQRLKKKQRESHLRFRSQKPLPKAWVKILEVKS